MPTAEAQQESQPGEDGKRRVLGRDQGEAQRRAGPVLGSQQCRPGTNEDDREQLDVNLVDEPDEGRENDEQEQAQPRRPSQSLADDDEPGHHDQEMKQHEGEPDIERQKLQRMIENRGGEGIEPEMGQVHLRTVLEKRREAFLETLEEGALAGPGDLAEALFHRLYGIRSHVGTAELRPAHEHGDIFQAIPRPHHRTGFDQANERQDGDQEPGDDVGAPGRAQDRPARGPFEAGTGRDAQGSDRTQKSSPQRRQLPHKGEAEKDKDEGQHRRPIEPEPEPGNRGQDESRQQQPGDRIAGLPEDCQESVPGRRLELRGGIHRCCQNENQDHTQTGRRTERQAPGIRVTVVAVKEDGRGKT